jgi:hypothetical protein
MVVSVITLDYDKYIAIQRTILDRCSVGKISGNDISSIPSEYDSAQSTYRVSICITELDQQELTCIVRIAEENDLKYYTTIENAQEYIILYALN